MIDLFIMAGEASGDVQGAHLCAALLKKQPHLSIKAVAGPHLRKLGLGGSARMEELQVMGFIDVFLALPRLVRLFFRIRADILRLQPKAVLCIDYPSFNLRLQRSLRNRGYKGKLIHYACPSVWAWGKKRIPLMAQQLDLLLSLFPFEAACFAHTSLRVCHIGHPLVTKILAQRPTSDFYARYGLDPARKLLAIFPGSRKAALARNLPLQLAAAKKLQKRDPSLQIAISLAHASLVLPSGYTLIQPEHHYDLMRSAHLALATSGTVTLELALFQTPTVVHYALTAFDIFLAKRVFKIHLPHYCIVNLLAEERVFAELIGPHLTQEALDEQALALFEDDKARQRCKIGCEKVLALLGTEDASEKAARAILEILT